MKSSRKIITIIASCMIVIGILLAVIGLSAGARFSITNTLDGFKVLGPEDRKIEEFPLSAFTNIKGDLTDADIEIIPSNEYKLKIERQKSTKITHEVENDTLVLEDNDSKSSPKLFLNLTFSSIPETVIKIYVPKETKFSDVSLVNKFGDTRLDGVITDKLKIDSNDGDIVLNDVQANELNIENGFGDITSSKVTTKVLNIDMNDGDAIFDTINAASTVLNNKFGDITFRNFTSEGLTMKSNDGDIEIQGMLLGNSTIHSSFGDVNLKLLNKKSDLSYNIRNKFGDITVNDNQFETKATNTTNSQNKLDITSNDGDVDVTF
ncbi:DUF4097 family beta strand repeat-containing protein [Cytobacillus dafuensis]|uniref:DUF4097 domain-containing protein n=1 Tax=Cytobacillus dafuensis TaxID=1742359 RepID=A0A5B8ZAR6_CYTDA|nr:DUF4097 family beta strand repeat-containing protein [Cytobacillus dafuensis]QED49353.1 DUF4097 domain-containing protein [Cytobacillus dafuensis]